MAPSRLASAEPSPVPTCPPEDGTLALSFDGDAWPVALLPELQGQLVVEAERLGLIACDGGSPPRPPTVQVQITSTPDGLFVDVFARPQGGERRLRRQLGAAHHRPVEYAAELAMVIGELAREALRAPPPVGPTEPPTAELTAPAPIAEPPRWALGARGVGELQWARSTPFFGVDLVGRFRPDEEWELSVSGAWRQTPRADTGLGVVDGVLVGGGGGLSYRLLGDHHHAVAITAGARLAGLRFNGTPGDGATGVVAWEWSAAGLLGVELSYAPASPIRLVLGLGGIYGLRGVTAQAGSEEPLSNRGPGLYLSVGAEGWR